MLVSVGMRETPVSEHVCIARSIERFDYANLGCLIRRWFSVNPIGFLDAKDRCYSCLDNVSEQKSRKERKQSIDSPSS